MESHTYFLADETNTAWTVDMILKMGSAETVGDRPGRMHWHYSTTEAIEYATADPKRTDIPWVRATRRDGTVRTYVDKESTWSASELAALTKRTMPCVDCHNRAGHYYWPPAKSVNALMSLKVIDPELPGLKGVAVEALDAEYATREEAHAGIRGRIEAFCRQEHPQASSSMKPHSGF